MTAAAPEVPVFQVAARDVRFLWNDMHGIVCQGLSPFAETDDAPPIDVPKSDLGTLTAIARNPAFAAVAATLSNPDSALECVTGGGSAPLGRVSLYRDREADPARVVAVSPSPGGAFLVHSFADADLAARWLARVVSRIPDFVAWDLDTMQEVAATFELPRDLPDELPLDTLLYLLHAIDVFRRAVYQNLLAYRTVDGAVTVAAKEFDETLGRSLRSGDVRWLLPAFHRLTPGLADFRVDPRPEHLERLARADLIRGGRRADTKEAVYQFGEVGTRVGVEFFRTWHTAAGIGLWTAGEPKTLRSSAFLAPTAFANHLFALERTADGHGVARHRALTEAGLADALRELLDTPAS